MWPSIPLTFAVWSRRGPQPLVPHVCRQFPTTCLRGLSPQHLTTLQRTRTSPPVWFTCSAEAGAVAEEEDAGVAAAELAEVEPAVVARAEAAPERAGAARAVEAAPERVAIAAAALSFTEPMARTLWRRCS